MIPMFFRTLIIESSKEEQLFEIEMFCKTVNVFIIVTFNKKILISYVYIQSSGMKL